jgi:AbrB family looped-hinge helix DNA binding protein
MDTLRLSTQGQIVIPKEIRHRHRWEPGTELIVEDQGDAIVLRAAKPFPRTRLEDGLGCAGFEGPAKTPEEMDAGIDEALRREWRRSGSR